MLENERIQEVFLMVGDKASSVNKKWWYVLLAFFILAIPGYYVAKYSFAQVLLKSHHSPQIIYTEAKKEPLQIVEKKIFALPGNAYSGFVKIKNINLEWGVDRQEYSAEFSTFGGSTITKVNGSTFILPSSEKLVVFSRFSSDKKPDEIKFSLGQTHFIHKPDISVDYEVERITLQAIPDTVVSAAIKNLTAFGIKQIGLPVVLFDRQNQIVGVNYTYLSDLGSGETRSFQYIWPGAVAGAVRAEISPEINVYDRNIFIEQSGVSPFEGQPQ